jgi:hypothetical protein
MEDRLAEAYNRAMEAWFQAQRDFEKKYGRKCTGVELMSGKVKISMSSEEAEAFNKVANFMNSQYARGLILTEEECPSNYLVKL